MELELLEKILAQFPDLDPATKLLFAVFVIIAGLATKVVGGSLSQKAKLAVFFTVVLLGSGLGLAALQRVAAQSANAGAEPAAIGAPSGGGLVRFTSVAYAQGRAGWVYCGKFDEKTRVAKAWAPGVRPVDASLRGALPTPGNRLKTVANTDIYGDQPRFTAVGFKWVLGDVDRTLPPGREVTVKGCRLFGDNGWCEVEG